MNRCGRRGGVAPLRLLERPPKSQQPSTSLHSGACQVVLTPGSSEGVTRGGALQSVTRTGDTFIVSCSWPAPPPLRTGLSVAIG